MSAVAWYEFSRGPRTPEQLAVARSFLGEDGVLAFSGGMAAHKRAADVAIGVTAVLQDAVLVTRNARDFAGIPDLRVEPAGPRSA